jgi:hypothetical protein
MAEVTISENLWRDLQTVARRQRRKPGQLAEAALREYLRRLSDEELLARSEQAARRAPFRAGDSEEVVRQHRRQSRSN